MSTPTAVHSGPSQARGTFAGAIPCLVATWALGGLSLPALIAGLAATKFGLHSTALVYSAALAALVAVAAGIQLFRRGGRR